MKFVCGAFGIDDAVIDLDELPGGDESVPKALALIAAHVMEERGDMAIVVPLHFVTDDGDEISLPGGADDLVQTLSESIKLAEWMNTDRRYTYDAWLYALVSEDWNQVDFDMLNNEKDRLLGSYTNSWTGTSREDFWKDYITEVHGGVPDYYENHIDWDSLADSEEEDYDVIEFNSTTYVFNR